MRIPIRALSILAAVMFTWTPLLLSALEAVPGVRMYALDCGAMADTLASMNRVEDIIRNRHARLIVQHDPGDYSRLPKSPAFMD
jgi:hypothetical protein